MSARKICVITGTRAEYGQLFWLMKEIDADPKLHLQLIVTGSHLESRFGHTVDVIESDGFAIDVRIPIDLTDSSPVGVVNSTALAASGTARALQLLDPDIVVVLGDRFEIFGAAQAAMISQFVIAHIHGGEITEGAIDDSLRHAITKMAHIHFVAAEPYRQRVLQMGENPNRTFTVGAISLDMIDRMALMGRDELAQDVGFNLDGDYFLVTYHPVTVGKGAPKAAAKALIDALVSFPNHKIILTGVNADPGSDAIRTVFQQFADANPGRVLAITSMGQRRYLSAMKYCAAVVGNSSSGLMEAPSLGVPTVNIGARQNGRIRASSVIDCAEDTADIISALKIATGEAHKKIARQTKSPFGNSGVSKRITDTLRDISLDGILAKRFVDISATPDRNEIN